MMWGRQEFKRGKTQIIKEKRQINLTILKCKAFILDKTMVHGPSASKTPGILLKMCQFLDPTQNSAA